MANNITINEGTARTVKTREVASEQVQAVYLNIGTAADNPYNGTVTEVTTVANLTNGTVRVTAGTVNTGTINAATVNASTVNSGTINAGTINAGSVGGLGASGAATVGNPVLMGGTDAGGTTYAPLVNTAGAWGSVANIGTIKEAGTVTGVGVVTTVTNLANGTIQNSGTTTGVGTVSGIAVVSNLTQGSINVTAGTIGGKGASGAATVGFPVLVGGTDSGGTLYSPLITTTGAVGSVQNIGTIKEAGTVTGVGVVTNITNLLNGTIQSAGTVTGVGTVPGVGVVSNLTQGSINVTAGTVGGKAASGDAAVANPVQIAGTDSGGTIYSPLVNTAGAWGSIANIGTIKQAGTVTGVGVVTTVTTVSNVTNGTIRVTAGTINSGTINAGTINTGTINSATINAGTMRDDGRAARDILSFGTVFGGTGTVFAYATLVAAPGASNYVFVNDLSITNPYGTVEAGIGYGTHADGGSVLVKGIIGTQTGFGIEKVYPKAVNGGITNQPLVLYRGNVGTIYANVSYFTST